MTFGNDKLTNLFPPLITLQRKIPSEKKKNFQAEISAGDFTKKIMFSAIWMKRVGLTALNRSVDRG